MLTGPFIKLLAAVEEIMRSSISNEVPTWPGLEAMAFYGSGFTKP
jgi:hypothetical protein